jgi:WD40 repeat protein
VLKEKDSDNITIEVSNARIAADIIMSFYGQTINSPNNKYLLESIKCKYFFGLDFDQSLLDNIEVSEEDFDLFMDVIDLIGYNEKTIKLINKNIPETYDLSKFPKELLNEMLSLGQIYHIVSCNDNSINVWDAESGLLIKKLTDHKSNIWCACYTSNNKYIISGDEAGNIHIWDAEKYCLVHTFFDDYSRGITCLCLSPDNQYILCGNRNDNIRIWDAQTYTSRYTMYGHGNTIRSLCYSPDGAHIASGSDDRTIKIWNSKTYFLIRTLWGHTNNINDICYSPDNKQIISFSTMMVIWNAISGDLIYTLDMKYDLCGICSLDGQYIALCDEYHIKILNAASYDLIYTLHDGNYDAIAVSFSPDSKYVITANDNDTITVWDIESNKLIHTMHISYGVNITCSSFYNTALTKKIEKIIKN